MGHVEQRPRQDLDELPAGEDTPRDLFERLLVNIELNDTWIEDNPQRVAGKIYSYPMRFAPIVNSGSHENRYRDLITTPPAESIDWATSPRWTPRFVRNVEIMKGAAHGAISPTSSLARRTIGSTFQEFVTNLYMPEELLRNRNKHEKKVYPFEQKRKQGTGLVGEFRDFISDLLAKQGQRFLFFRLFHHAKLCTQHVERKGFVRAGYACFREALNLFEDRLQAIFPQAEREAF